MNFSSNPTTCSISTPRRLINKYKYSDIACTVSAQFDCTTINYFRMTKNLTSSLKITEVFDVLASGNWEVDYLYESIYDLHTPVPDLLIRDTISEKFKNIYLSGHLLYKLTSSKIVPLTNAYSPQNMKDAELGDFGNYID